jgi:transcriptional regulator with XRE-family HTH domain
MVDEDNKYQFIGQRIRDAREAVGISQRELAEKLGYESATAISYIEAGERKVSVVDLELIAQILDKDGRYFIGQEDKPPSVRVALRAEAGLNDKDKDAILHIIEWLRSGLKAMDPTSEKARIGTAGKLARGLIKKSGIKEPPVSLRTIIHYLQLTHDLGVYPSAGFSDRLSGILVTIEDESSGDRRDEIHYNEKQSWHRQRFSIAHEIGHLLFNTSCDVPHRIRTVEEQEADQFAAELLMPLSFLKADFGKEGVNVKSLACRYIVSEEAMGGKLWTRNSSSRGGRECIACQLFKNGSL